MLFSVIVHPRSLGAGTTNRLNDETSFDLGHGARKCGAETATRAADLLLRQLPSMRLAAVAR